MLHFVVTEITSCCRQSPLQRSYVQLTADVRELKVPVSPQVTVLRSYDTMIATARRQPEGSLIYIIDKADLYLRVGNGLRQVMVQLLDFPR